MLKKVLIGVISGLIILSANDIAAQHSEISSFEIPYGNNPDAGIFKEINGTRIYFETYGSGESLMLIHGNLGDISKMSHQIDFFSKHYRVIVPDCRGRGKSDMNTDSLTYELITSDLVILMDSLDVEKCHIIGWSDGGIVGLMMGIKYPSKVNKIVAMAANLWPDTTALIPWMKSWIVNSKQESYEMIKVNDLSKDWKTYYQLMDMMDTQPNILLSELQSIQSPVMIIAGDKDLIRDEHTVLMYQNIPNAHLWIIPGGTHFAPIRQADLFNTTVDRFLSKPFNRPDGKF